MFHGDGTAAAMTDSTIFSRLEGAFSEIVALQDVCGVPSISVGVLHDGKILYTKSVGRRTCDEGDGASSDHEATPDSVYLTASSCSKLLLACAVGILVDEGKMDWDDLISQHIPQFNPVNDPSIAKEATIRHALSHATGVGRQMPLLLGIRGTLLVNEENFVSLVNQAPTHPKGENNLVDSESQGTGRGFIYSNFPLALVALAVQRISGQRYTDFIQERILKPLNLSNTILTKEGLKANGNVAAGYAKLKDGSFAKVDTGEMTDECQTPVLGFLGVQSTVNDMLKLTSYLIEAYNNELQVSKGSEQEHRNPFRQVPVIWSAQNKIDEGLSYGMGCYLGSFASEVFSAMGINTKTFSQDYDFFQDHVVGKDFQKQNLTRSYISHIGYYIGFSSSITVFPESRTSIVAFANGMDLGDAADWSTKLLAQALFDTTPHVNIVALAKREAELHKACFDDMLLEWLEDRNVMHKERDLSEYVGTYEACNTTISISMCEETGHLAVTFNGRSKASVNLEIYDEDAYSFLPLTKDDYLRKGMADWDCYYVGVLYFSRDDEGNVKDFEWRYEADEDSGFFIKKEDK